MEPNCQNQPCRELTELQKRFTRFQDDTVKRLAAGDVSMATINTKLNWLIGILSGIGAAVLAAVLNVKMDDIIVYKTPEAPPEPTPEES